jgi:hypothetical protein
MSSSSSATSNGTSSLVLLLLVLNLVVAIAALAHLVYYIPEGSQRTDTDSSVPQIASALLVDGVGNIGMGSKGIELEMIELNQKNPTGEPRVMQTVTMSQEAFLNTLDRMSLLRDRLVEKELVREVE